VPTVADRIAQTVVAGYLEPEVEPHFHPDVSPPTRTVVSVWGGAWAAGMTSSSTVLIAASLKGSCVSSRLI
jgi:hypothetical protein